MDHIRWPPQRLNRCIGLFLSRRFISFCGWDYGLVSTIYITKSWPPPVNIFAIQVHAQSSIVNFPISFKLLIWIVVLLVNTIGIQMEILGRSLVCVAYLIISFIRPLLPFHDNIIWYLRILEKLYWMSFGMHWIYLITHGKYFMQWLSFTYTWTWRLVLWCLFSVLMDWGQLHYQLRNLRLSLFVPLLMHWLVFLGHCFAQSQLWDKACFWLLDEKYSLAFAIFFKKFIND